MDDVGVTRLTGKLMRRYGRETKAREQLAMLLTLLDDDHQPTSSIYSLIASLPPPRAPPQVSPLGGEGEEIEEKE